MVKTFWSNTYFKSFLINMVPFCIGINSATMIGTFCTQHYVLSPTVIENDHFSHRQALIHKFHDQALLIFLFMHNLSFLLLCVCQLPSWTNYVVMNSIMNSLYLACDMAFGTFNLPTD